MYSRHPVLILDDVFSGLDSRTARVVLDRLFGENGHFRKQGVSVIVATHSRTAILVIVSEDLRL